jgi:hypothetical protein
MVIIVFSITMFGTVILSPLLLASESEESVIVIDPNSYYAVRVEVYGIGMLEYTESQISGPPVFLVELTQANYEKLVAGEDYDHKGYFSLGVGGGGMSSETGAFMVRYLVFVNENPTQAEVEFGYQAVPLVSLMIAGPLFAASLLIVLCMVIQAKRRHKAV